MPVKHRPTQEQARQLSRHEMSELLGWSDTVLRKRLIKHAYVVSHFAVYGKGPVRYESKLVEVLRALYGQAHGLVEDPGADWLSRYMSSGGTSA